MVTLLPFSRWILEFHPKESWEKFRKVIPATSFPYPSAKEKELSIQLASRRYFEVKIMDVGQHTVANVHVR